MIVFFPLGCLQPQSSDTGSEINIESRPTDVTNTEDTSSDVTEDNNEPEPIYLSEGIWAFSNLTLTGQTCGFPNETIEQLIEDLGLVWLLQYSLSCTTITKNPSCSMPVNTSKMVRSTLNSQKMSPSSTKPVFKEH
jgi:hypothetical protein